MKKPERPKLHVSFELWYREREWGDDPECWELQDVRDSLGRARALKIRLESEKPGWEFCIVRVMSIAEVA